MEGAAEGRAEGGGWGGARRNSLAWARCSRLRRGVFHFDSDSRGGVRGPVASLQTMEAQGSGLAHMASMPALSLTNSVLGNHRCVVLCPLCTRFLREGWRISGRCSRS